MKGNDSRQWKIIFIVLLVFNVLFIFAGLNESSSGGLFAGIGFYVQLAVLSVIDLVAILCYVFTQRSRGSTPSMGTRILIDAVLIIVALGIISVAIVLYVFFSIFPIRL